MPNILKGSVYVLWTCFSVYILEIWFPSYTYVIATSCCIANISKNAILTKKQQTLQDNLAIAQRVPFGRSRSVRLVLLFSYCLHTIMKMRMLHDCKTIILLTGFIFFFTKLIPFLLSGQSSFYSVLGDKLTSVTIRRIVYYYCGLSQFFLNQTLKLMNSLA